MTRVIPGIGVIAGVALCSLIAIIGGAISLDTEWAILRCTSIGHNQAISTEEKMLVYRLASYAGDKWCGETEHPSPDVQAAVNKCDVWDELPNQEPEDLEDYDEVTNNMRIGAILVLATGCVSFVLAIAMVAMKADPRVGTLAIVNGVVNVLLLAFTLMAILVTTRIPPNVDKERFEERCQTSVTVSTTVVQGGAILIPGTTEYEYSTHAGAGVIVVGIMGLVGSLANIIMLFAYPAFARFLSACSRPALAPVSGDNTAAAKEPVHVDVAEHEEPVDAADDDEKEEAGAAQPEVA
jgi:hypothetical protein